MESLNALRRSKLEKNVGEISMFNVSSDHTGYDSRIRVYSFNDKLGIRGMMTLSKKQADYFRAAPAIESEGSKRPLQASHVGRLIQYDIGVHQGTRDRMLLEKYLVESSVLAKTKRLVERQKEMTTTHIFLIDWVTNNQCPLIIPGSTTLIEKISQRYLSNRTKSAIKHFSNVTPSFVPEG
jgi:hypothetical protein